MRTRSEWLDNERMEYLVHGLMPLQTTRPTAQPTSSFSQPTSSFSHHDDRMTAQVREWVLRQIELRESIVAQLRGLLPAPTNPHEREDATLRLLSNPGAHPKK